VRIFEAMRKSSTDAIPTRPKWARWRVNGNGILFAPERVNAKEPSMGAQLALINPAPAATTRADDIALQLRIRAEFAEMPGLKLTLPQASRLFHVESVRCQRLLGALVATGILKVSGDTFVRPAA
jgi:hypothetical protein